MSANYDNIWMWLRIPSVYNAIIHDQCDYETKSILTRESRDIDEAHENFFELKAQELKVQHEFKRSFKDYINSITELLNEFKDPIYESKKLTLYLTISGVFLGLLVGIMCSISTGSSIYMTVGYIFGAVFGFFGFLLGRIIKKTWPIPGVVLFGFLLFPVGLKYYDTILEGRKKKAREAQAKETLDSLISEIKHNAHIARKQLWEKTDKEIADFEARFEQEVENASVKYADSEAIKEIARLLTQVFLKTIESANRDPYIRNIIVRFNIDVGDQDILCNAEKYILEDYGCDESCIWADKVALTRVLASQIELNTRMQYANDSSGTEYKIDIDCVYPEARPVDKPWAFEAATDYIIARLVYKASNGNFIPAQ